MPLGNIIFIENGVVNNACQIKKKQHLYYGLKLISNISGKFSKGGWLTFKKSYALENINFIENGLVSTLTGTILARFFL